MSEKVIVVGLGEVGKPLFEILQGRYEVYGVDIGTPDPIPQCEIMHLCFGFNGDRFVAEAVRYIQKFRPALTIIDSTVAPGTTRRIAQEAGAAVVHSPVRGKHVRMKEELLRYTKFIGALGKEAGQKAFEHFEGIGMRPKLLSSPEASELAKLTETTYFGLLIAWAQEVERYSQKLGVEYDEVVGIYEEIQFLPRAKYFPGTIGGHCVMPNIQILKTQFKSGLLEAIEKSDAIKRSNAGAAGWSQ